MSESVGTVPSSHLAVLDFVTPNHAMRLASLHPGVRVDDVINNTGFELIISDKVPQLRLIREVIDPKGIGNQEVKA